MKPLLTASLGAERLRDYVLRRYIHTRSNNVFTRLVDELAEQLQPAGAVGESVRNTPLLACEC